MTYSNDLLQLAFIDIPFAKKKIDGFLNVIDKQFDEVINTRIYSYFLDKANNSDIACVFLNSLLELITEKTKKNVTVADYTCETEITTKSGKRIDLAIHSIEDSSVIIIENKLFHTLNNDLESYWNHYAYADVNKIGIVLTLHCLTINNEKFINITHSEWINRIKYNGLPSGLPINLYVYLNDFLSNMENLSHSNELNNQAKFFFDHPEKVLAAKETYNVAIQHILNQLSVAAIRMGYEIPSIRSEYYRYLRKRKDVHYTIVFDELLKGKRSIKIIIETHGNATKKEKELRSILTGNTEYEKLNKNGSRASGWLHFALKDYSNLTNENISSLGDFIIKSINEDFEPVMNLLTSCLDNAK